MTSLDDFLAWINEERKKGTKYIQFNLSAVETTEVVSVYRVKDVIHVDLESE